RAIIAPAGDRGRAALLLPAVDPVRPAVVGDDVIHLRRRLVVPTAPRLAAVDGDRRALIGTQDHNVALLWFDPAAGVIVSPSPPRAHLNPAQVLPPSIDLYEEVLATKTISGFFGCALISAKSEPRPQSRVSPLILRQLSPASSER